MVKYDIPFKFTELSEEAKNNAVEIVEKKEWKQEGVNPILAKLFYTIYMELEKLGLKFEKILADAGDIQKIRLEGYDKNSLKAIIQRRLSKNLKATFQFLMKESDLINIESSSIKLWETEPLKITISEKNASFRNDVDTSFNNVIRLMNIVCLCNSDEEVTSRYSLLLLMKDSLEESSLTEEMLKQLKDDVSSSLILIQNQLEDAINSEIKKVYQSIKSEIQYAQSEECRLNYYKDILNEELSSLWLKYYFDEQGNVISEYLVLDDNYKDRYGEWIKYEKIKIKNPMLYKQIAGYANIH